MISSQRPWPLDHEAGPCVWYKNLKNEEAMVRVGPQRHGGRGGESIAFTAYIINLFTKEFYVFFSSA